LSWGKPLSYLFGSLYIPSGKEEFAIGLGKNELNPHTTLAKAYYVPVVDVFRQIRRKFSR
jgi:hypothetical protein